MQIVLLLIMVFLIAAFIGKKESPYGRIVVGSVFGVFVFSFWRFFLYYADLLHWSELNKQIAFLATGVAAVILSIFLVKIKHELSVAIICFASFVIVMVISYSAEAPIKNAIAFQTNYFKDKTSETIGFKPGENTSTFKHPAGSYQVSVPQNWVLRTDKGPMFQYFQLMDGNAVAVEFRPTCFKKETAVITDIVSSIRDRQQNSSKQPEVQCYHHGDAFYSCRIVQYSVDQKINRINWVGIRDDIAKGVDLDFVFFQNRPDALRDIDDIINSLAPVREKSGDSPCLGLAEWF